MNIAKFKDFINKLGTTIRSLSIVNKAILGGVFILFIIGGLVSYLNSTQTPYSMLFSRALTVEEYGSISQALEKMQVDFQTKDDKYILVKDEALGREVRMKLAQNGQLPNTIKSWELFDMNDWTTTEFDRDVKLRRALMGQMKKHLEAMDWIERVDVSLTMPEKKLYSEQDEDASVSISITPAPGFRDYLSDKKKIKGIEMIVLRGIDGLKAENIVLTDDTGLQLNDFKEDEMGDRIKMAYEERKIINREKAKIREEIKTALLGVLAEDRYRVAVDIDMNFDKEKERRKEVLPIIVKERTPGLAYDDGQILTSVKVSEKDDQEEFKGQGYIPEGPPGQEANVPPGYKDNVDRWNHYNKNGHMTNYLNGEKEIEKEKDFEDIGKRSVAVIVDGTWDLVRDEKGELVKEGDHYKRAYTPYLPEDLKKLEEILRAQVGFDSKRGDQVVVKNIAFDRSQMFASEDAEIERGIRIRKAVVFFSLMMLSFFIILFLVKVAQNEMRRKQRQREIEEELARQREVENSLRVLLKDEEVGEFHKPEDEILGKILEAVGKEPEMIAKILKNWILE